MHLDFFYVVRVKSYACPLKYDTQAAEPFFEGIWGFKVILISSGGH
jgi:hypothetical protein